MSHVQCVHAFRFCEAGDVDVSVRVGLGVNTDVLKRAALVAKYEIVFRRHAA